jgi:alpha-galactosidase
MTGQSPTPDLVVLRAGGAALVLDPTGPGMPEVLHWGADLATAAGEAAAEAAPPAYPEVYAALKRLTGAVPHNGLDQPWPLTILPSPADGWLGTPAVALHQAGGRTAPRWQVTDLSTDERRVVIRAADESFGLDLEHELAFDSHGVLHARATLSRPATAEAAGPNRSSPVDAPVDAPVDEPVDVSALRLLLPLPARASEVLDLTGRWCRERSPQRSRVQDGTHLRTGRRGRTGHDATLLLSVGTPGFDFRSGEVWCAHVAWSGDHEHLVERLPEGAGLHAAVLGGGEALAPGEVRLGPGQSYTTPEVLFTYAGDGLDGVSRRLHASQRARAGYPTRPRPLVLNTWEAVYFDHDLGRLRDLADTAAAVGVERFVLDDGWFGGRRHDRAGLGDWVVSPEVWPEGLGPIVDHVKGLGMEFGLWFEPEMVNVDSDLVRAHPDWVLGPVAGHPRVWRHQQVLDLANPAAADHIVARIRRLVSEYGIDFIKWDHNRDLMESVRSGPGLVDAPATHAQTTALYAVLDRLRAAHPRLEIESCASGGGRVDLGILTRTDRIWTSDCNDALERAHIQRWTSLLVPAELMGSHAGPPTAHTTQRTLDLSFRLLMALQGHAGLEWDITSCTAEERAALTAWSGLYRELRRLLHGGELVRDEADEGSLLVTGTLSEGREQAVYSIARLHTSSRVAPGLVRLAGLDPVRSYTVRLRTEVGLPQTLQTTAPSWWQAALQDGFQATGAFLGGVGLPMPILAPEQGFLLHLT